MPNISDQELKSYVLIKAVDHSGNARLIEINPTVSLSVYDKLLFWVIITGSILMVLFISIKLWAKRNL